MTVSLCLVGGLPGTASAAPAGELSDVLTRAAPTETPVVPFADGVTATVGDLEVDLPTPGNDTVTVTAASDADPLRAQIVLPPQFDTGAGASLTDGTVVFPDRERPGDDLAVQVLADGSTRIQTVLGSASSAREYAYSVNGYSPVEADGSFGFLAEGQQGGFVPVAAAWATDAQGRVVPTHYEIRGMSLVQVVEPQHDTTYPVVADPAWSWMWGGYGAKLDRYETHRVIDYSYAVGMCAGIARWANKDAGIACGVYGAYISAQAHLADSDRPRTCLFLVVVPAPLVMRYRDGHCR
jgi:hypothetical protein